MFRLCCWRVPNTHEMSINPVRAARITDTTGALLSESRGRRRPRNTVKNDVFQHPAQKNLVDTYKLSTGGRAGVDRGSGGGRPKGSAAGAASVYNLRLPTEGLRQGNVRVAGARIYARAPAADPLG